MQKTKRKILKDGCYQFAIFEAKVDRNGTHLVLSGTMNGKVYFDGHRCSVCEEWFDKEEISETDGNYYCEDCRPSPTTEN